MGGLAGYLAPGAEGPVRAMLETMRWRGPDGDGVVVSPWGALGHLRLATDPEGGRQPLASPDRRFWIALNGAVYNYEPLRRRLGAGSLPTPAAPAVVLALFQAEGPGFLHRLLGMYALAIWDGQDRLFLARDPLGIKPLYYGYDARGRLAFASEIKALLRVTRDVREFPPGHYYQTGVGLRPFYPWAPPRAEVRDPGTAVRITHRALVKAVRRCLVAGVPVGAFLSGGLDSTLVTAVARRLHGPGLKTFAAGMVGSPDLDWARAAARHLGTDHHEYAYTPDEVKRVLPEVIYHLESYDPPLVRGAVATWFAGRLAGAHVKAVLTGEGADELFAGYHYLKEYAGDWDRLGAELVHITRGLHHTNLQRCDRETMAHGVEARVPFLELPVVEAALAIHPSLKLGPDGRTEKWVLRQVAAALLPAPFARRRKEKFALGTGTGQFLAQYAAEAVSDAELARARAEAGVTSKEEALYWRYFREHFHVEAVLRGMGRSRTLGDYEKNPAAWRSAPA